MCFSRLRVFDEIRKLISDFSILNLLVYILDSLHKCITLLYALMVTDFFILAKFFIMLFDFKSKLVRSLQKHK